MNTSKDVTFKEQVKKSFSACRNDIEELKSNNSYLKQIIEQLNTNDEHKNSIIQNLQSQQVNGIFLLVHMTVKTYVYI